jgi:Ca-activated chloride channel homolog
MNRRLAIRILSMLGAGFFLRLQAKPESKPGPKPGSRNDTRDEQPEQPGDFTLRSEVRLVLLDVSVTGKEGGFVTDLSRENFTVLEEGVPQRISVFDHNDAPVTCGLVVDESRSMTPKRQNVLDAATAFIEASNPQDEIFVLNFNDTVKRGLPDGTLFSDDIAQLQGALYRGKPAGKTALYDAVLEGLEQLELGKQDKKTLVVVSDGGDNVSVHTRREMLDRVQRSVATIFAIGLYDPDDLEHDLGILKELAHISGGEAYFPENPPETIPICRRIAQDIRSRYTLGYHPQPGKTRLRHIEVKARHIEVGASSAGHGKLNVRARRSYWYEDSNANAAKPAPALD